MPEVDCTNPNCNNGKVTENGEEHTCGICHGTGKVLVHPSRGER